MHEELESLGVLVERIEARPVTRRFLLVTSSCWRLLASG